MAKGIGIMADTERAGYARMAAKIVLQLPEFPSFRKMLDLGGGPGLIGMAIVDAHPSMKAINFDLPPVVQAAKAYIKEYGMEDRVKVLGEDFNQDAIGEGYDLIWAAAVFQFAVDLDAVIGKVHAALNPGGVFVSLLPFGLTQERTKPESTVLNLLSMALMGQELEIDQGDVADSMLHVGFKSVRSRTIHTPFFPMELDIARK